MLRGEIVIVIDVNSFFQSLLSIEKLIVNSVSWTETWTLQPIAFHCVADRHWCRKRYKLWGQKNM